MECFVAIRGNHIVGCSALIWIDYIHLPRSSMFILCILIYWPRLSVDACYHIGYLPCIFTFVVSLMLFFFVRSSPTWSPSSTTLFSIMVVHVFFNPLLSERPPRSLSYEEKSSQSHFMSSSWAPLNKGLFDVATFFEVRRRLVRLEARSKFSCMWVLHVARRGTFSSTGNTLNQSRFKIGIEAHGERHHHMTNELWPPLE